MHHRQGLDIDTDIFILISHKIIVRTPPKYNYLPALNLKKKKKKNCPYEINYNRRISTFQAS